MSDVHCRLSSSTFFCCTAFLSVAVASAHRGREFAWPGDFRRRQSGVHAETHRSADHLSANRLTSMPKQDTRSLVLLRQEVASSGVTVRATLREHFLRETGHERGPAGTVRGLC